MGHAFCGPAPSRGRPLLPPVDIPPVLAPLGCALSLHHGPSFFLTTHSPSHSQAKRKTTTQLSIIATGLDTSLLVLLYQSLISILCRHFYARACEIWRSQGYVSCRSPSRQLCRAPLRNHHLALDSKVAYCSGTTSEDTTQLCNLNYIQVDQSRLCPPPLWRTISCSLPYFLCLPLGLLICDGHRLANRVIALGLRENRPVWSQT